MKTKKSNVRTLDQFKDQHYGKPGTVKRDQFEAGYEHFKIGALLHEARLEKGLTQEQLAEKVGTTKSYISKIENNIKEYVFLHFKGLWNLVLVGRCRFRLNCRVYPLVLLKSVGAL